MSDADLYIATDSALTRIGGKDVMIEAGQTVVRAGHPLLKGREHMFRPLTVHYDVPEEEPAQPRRASRKEQPAPQKPAEP